MSENKMKIYTKNGDKGKTSLVSGSSISKADSRLRAYGELDELNSHIGFSLVESQNLSELQLTLLKKVQDELFVAGSHLATESEKRKQLKLPELTDDLTEEIEKSIDLLSSEIPELKNFILPGGCELSARFNLCRVICRRVETTVVALQEELPSEVPGELVILLNRLSDYFFVVARWANIKSNTEEIIWKGR